MHAVQQLYQYRKSISTKPFNARGKKVNRCENCRVAKLNCICHLTPETESDAAFLLLMYDTEVLKPSNTGRLIADLFDDTYAFLWNRTKVEQSLMALLTDEKWQPILIFPAEYVAPEAPLFINELPSPESVNTADDSIVKRRPLFILLDGSWREAKKMFRKSEYLRGIPVVSFDPSLISKIGSHQYIRKANKGNQLATAEVAANILALFGEYRNSKLLTLWFDVFNYQYQKSVCQANHGNENALKELEDMKEGKL